ncbi:MAG: hypothetical protein ACQEXJ_09430 [Myxococcota bacterium]
MGPVEILVIVLVPLGIGLYLLRRRVGRWRAEVSADVDARLGRDRIRLRDDMANFFGLESWGLGQVRGNGCLAATDDEVLFVMWVPRRTIRVDRAFIEAVETPRSHLGKTKGPRLLRLRFRSPEGGEDSAAWLVRNLDRWVSLLAPSE